MHNISPNLGHNISSFCKNVHISEIHGPDHEAGCPAILLFWYHPIFPTFSSKFLLFWYHPIFPTFLVSSYFSYFSSKFLLFLQNSYFFLLFWYPIFPTFSSKFLLFLLFWYHPIFPTFSSKFLLFCFRMCITFTIIKVNILHNISPNFGAQYNLIL